MEEIIILRIVLCVTVALVCVSFCPFINKLINYGSKEMCVRRVSYVGMFPLLDASKMQPSKLKTNEENM